MNAAPGAQDIHIWKVDLDDAAWDRLSAALSAGEARRAEGLRTPALRQRYRRCRTALRCILAGYLQRSARTIDFSTTAFGKPELPGGSLHFNVSHSAGEALVAVAGIAVGVDIEVRGERVPEVEEIARWACHPQERDALARLRAEERLEAFYRIWAQKEAYAKAVGLGLRLAFSAIRPQPLPGRAVARIAIDGGAQRPAYYAYDLSVFTGHASSVCVPLENAQLHEFRRAAARR